MFTTGSVNTGDLNRVGGSQEKSGSTAEVRDSEVRESIVGVSKGRDVSEQEVLKPMAAFGAIKGKVDRFGQTVRQKPSSSKGAAPQPPTSRRPAPQPPTSKRSAPQPPTTQQQSRPEPQQSKLNPQQSLRQTASTPFPKQTLLKTSPGPAQSPSGQQATFQKRKAPRIPAPKPPQSREHSASKQEGILSVIKTAARPTVSTPTKTALTHGKKSAPQPPSKHGLKVKGRAPEPPSSGSVSGKVSVKTNPAVPKGAPPEVPDKSESLLRWIRENVGNDYTNRVYGESAGLPELNYNLPEWDVEDGDWEGSLDGDVWDDEDFFDAAPQQDQSVVGNDLQQAKARLKKHSGQQKQAAERSVSGAGSTPEALHSGSTANQMELIGRAINDKQHLLQGRSDEGYVSEISDDEWEQ